MNHEYIAWDSLKRVIPRLNKYLFRSQSAFNKNHLGTSRLSKSMPAALHGVATYKGTKEELVGAIEDSNDVLVTAHTVLTLFRDKVELDRAKLTLTRHNFISTSETVSIRLDDILNAAAIVGPFFGSLKITIRMQNIEPYIIGKLTRRDTLKLKRVIQGYMIALERNIDCNSIPTKELVKLLDKLGEGEHT